MINSVAVPFVVRRDNDVIAQGEITSTTEELHGLLRIVDDTLVVQWRPSREVTRVGSEIRTDREIMPVQEARIPLEAVASARVMTGWPKFLRSPRLEIIGGDLAAFEVLRGAEGMPGLVFEHPAELKVELRKVDRPIAEEFCAELELVNAGRALADAERRSLLRGA